MSIAIGEIRGISDSVAAALKAQGLSNSQALLEAANTDSERNKLAKTIGITASELLELVNRADLARIVGIGGVYSDLMEAAGVDTVKELARRNPDNLHAKLLEINTLKDLTPRPPSADQITDFVEQAKALPPMIEY
jgi:predicted flap endonuclease-1-like 5' DNA nuclease